MDRSLYITSMLGLSILLIYSIVSYKKTVLNLFDILLLSFIIWNFASFYWATNPSLIWGTSFAWLIMFLVYKKISAVNFSKIKLSTFLKITLIVLSTSYFFLAFIFIKTCLGNENFGFHYNDLSGVYKYMGTNGNYIGTCLVLFFPILISIFDKLPRWRIYSSFLIAFNFVIIILFNSRGTLIAFVLQILFYIYFYRNRIFKKNNFKYISFFTIAAVIAFFIINDKGNFFHHLNPSKDIISEHGDDRIELWNNSIQLIQDNALTGVGAGNWQIENMRFDAGAYRHYFDKAGYYRHPHNQFLHMFSELGLIGGGLYLLIILFSLYTGYKLYRKNQDNIFFITPLLIMLSYLFLSHFYGVIYSSNGVLKIPQLIFFIVVAISIAMIKLKPLFKISGLLNLVLIVLSFGFLFFSYQVENTYRSFLALKKAKQQETALGKIRSIYYPNFLTIVNNRSLKSEEAILLNQMKRKSEAKVAMQKSLRDLPVFFHWNYLSTINKPNKKAERESLETSYSKNNTYLKTQLALVELCIKEKKWEEAKQWLEFYYSLGMKTKRSNLKEDHKIDFLREHSYKIKTYKKYRDKVKLLETQIEEGRLE